MYCISLCCPTHFLAHLHLLFTSISVQHQLDPLCLEIFLPFGLLFMNNRVRLDHFPQVLTSLSGPSLSWRPLHSTSQLVFFNFPAHVFYFSFSPKSKKQLPVSQCQLLHLYLCCFPYFLSSLHQLFSYW